MPDVIEIRDSNIDATAVLRQLRDNVRNHQAHVSVEDTLPDFELPAIPAVENSTLRYHLHQLNSLYDQVWVSLSLFPSPATQIPIVGRLWGLLRESMHRLILYYVEMAISKQIGVNLHVVGSINSLSEMQAELLSLRQEVEALRQQLAEKTS